MRSGGTGRCLPTVRPRHNRLPVNERYFKHLYQPPPGADRRTLLLLHGPSGDEHELLPLAQHILPTAGILSTRGQLEINGNWAYYRRLRGGHPDVGDMLRCANQLAAFIDGAAKAYRFDTREVIAVGLGDGATVAATLLLAWPYSLAGLALFRGALPGMPDKAPRLPGTPVLLSNGRHDPVVSPYNTGDVANILRLVGANVTVSLQTAAQQLVRGDLEQAQAWFTSCGSMRSPMRMS